MGYQFSAYAQDDFDAVHALLCESYRLNRRPSDWLFARWEDWRFGGNSQRIKQDPGFFTRNCALWRRQGAVVAAAVAEYGNAPLALLIHPDHTVVLPEMLYWIEEVWGQGRPPASIEAAADDAERGALLRQHGYAPQEAVATQRAYALAAPVPFAVLPESFQFTTAAEEVTPDSFIAAVAAAFGNAAIGPDWYASIASAPGFHPEWLIQVRAPGGNCAAFAKISIDAGNHAAEIDPVGTHPAYQRMGLARALLLESFRRLRLAGIQQAWIGSAPAPAPANLLYDQLKPALRYDVVAWQKQFPASA